MTDRLRLTPIDPEDTAMIDALFAIQSDRATWEHLPAAVETDISQTVYLAKAHALSARDYGLGWWAVSLRESVGSLTAGKSIGLGGADVRIRSVPAWNLGYRLTPAAWGHGFATELGAAAIEAANGTRPELPVVARALSHNAASGRVLERLGLTLAWEGPVTQPNLPTSAMDLRVYADRPLSERLVGQIAALG